MGTPVKLHAFKLPLRLWTEQAKGKSRAEALTDAEHLLPRSLTKLRLDSPLVQNDSRRDERRNGKQASARLD